MDLQVSKSGLRSQIRTGRVGSGRDGTGLDSTRTTTWPLQGPVFLDSTHGHLLDQHPPVHHEGWMVSSQETVFLLDSSSLVNHGDYLSSFFSLVLFLKLPIPSSRLLVGSKNSPFTYVKKKKNLLKIHLIYLPGI
jgi:hypothetical protein